MSGKLAMVRLFHGGKFVRRPMLEYVGGTMDLVYVDITSMSYERFITDIENGANGKFEKLYFNYPGKSLEDGLRFIFDDSNLVDLLFRHLHRECLEVYGEYFDDEIGEGASHGEGIGEGGQGIGVGNGEGFVQGEGIGEGVSEGINIDDDFLIDQCEEIDSDSEHSDLLVDAKFFTDDEDKDDEDLVESRKNIREFHKRATKGWIQVEPVTEVVPSQQSIGESSIPQRPNEVISEAGYQTDYYGTDGDESLDSNVEEEDVYVTRRKSKFPSYDPDYASPFFITSMKFDDGRQFKDALKKYSVAERREIKMLSKSIPCSHAICALNHKKNNVYDYIDECYKKEKFLLAYKNMLMPVRGERFWKKTNRKAPEPLPARVKPGRRKHKRLREEGEVPSRTRMSRRGMKMTCRTCKKTGHNSLTCPMKKAGCTTSQTQFSRQRHPVQRRTSKCASGSVGRTPIASAAPVTPVESTSARQDKRQRVDIAT